jgi:hypothetical protein
MTELLDKLLGLAAKKETVSAACPPDTWLYSCESLEQGGRVVWAKWVWAHLTPQCGVRYTTTWNTTACP